MVAHKQVWELYNLEKDPVEENNLIYQETEKANTLKKEYLEWEYQFNINEQ
jgi:hypothetical protein